MRSAFGVGLLFSLVGTALVCAIDGTLIGSETHRRYFIEDGWNIALYTLVTPTYFALGCWLIVLTIRHWAGLAAFGDEAAGGASLSRTKRLGLALTIAFGLCALFTTTYIHDVLNPDLVQEVYWFSDADVADAPTDNSNDQPAISSNEGVNADQGPAAPPGSGRVLNRAGYYYIALNLGLLFVTLLSIGCFFTLTAAALRIGSSLPAGRVRDFGELRKELEAFTTAYLIAKLMAAVYIVNAFIWKDSPLGKASNLVAAGLAITTVGVFFVAVPRLYVELKWFQYANGIRSLESREGEGDEDEYRDLRSPDVRLWAHILDLVLIGSFIGTFWGLDLNPSTLLKLLRGAE